MTVDNKTEKWNGNKQELEGIEDKWSIRKTHPWDPELRRPNLNPKWHILFKGKNVITDCQPWDTA